MQLNFLRMKKKSLGKTDQTKKLALTTFLVLVTTVTASFVVWTNLDDRSRAANLNVPSLKLGTFSPPITSTLRDPIADPTYKLVPTIRETGRLAKSYCIDSKGSVPGNEPCNETIKFDIKVGVAGVTGSCGTVVSQSQKIMEYLQQGSNGLWDQMNTAIINCGYAVAPTSPYLSSYNIIDSYNLAGFTELTRTSYSRVEDLQNWWKSAKAQAAGYRFYNYTGGTLQTLIPYISPGFVVFLRSHAGILNSIEIDSRGNGWISILHSNTTYWLGVIIVANWNIVNTPGNFPVTGFGGH